MLKGIRFNFIYPVIKKGMEWIQNLETLSEKTPFR
ncbi:hypothetical protein SAFG77S_10493 [Streptomyces afghaniensis]